MAAFAKPLLCAGRFISTKFNLKNEMKILKFEWDNAKGDEHNGKSLIIGQHLPKRQNFEITHIETYGISLDIIDSSKDFQLKRHSCFGGNIVGDVSEISKEDARKLLYLQIDNALDVMFDETERNSVNQNLNTEIQEDVDLDDE